jgi:peptidoglycan/LPS O-acetylase OafA/YrhL
MAAKKSISAKRWWIPAVGYALAIGFINNLMIAPFTGQELVEWGPMLTALGILLGISGARDYMTKNKVRVIPENVSDKGWKRLWIPCVGWALFGGFFINCALAPYINLHPNDWTQLVSTLTVLLGISGARDVGLMPNKEENENTENTEEDKIPDGLHGGLMME